MTSLGGAREWQPPPTFGLLAWLFFWYFSLLNVFLRASWCLLLEGVAKRWNSLLRTGFVLRHTVTDPGEAALLPNANCAIPWSWRLCCTMWCPGHLSKVLCFVSLTIKVDNAKGKCTKMINKGRLQFFWITTRIFSFENKLCTGTATAPGNFIAVETGLLLYWLKCSLRHFGKMSIQRMV